MLTAIAGIGLIVGAVVITGKDFPSVIQDDQIVSVITRECDIMTETVESMPVTGDPDEQLAILADQNKAVEKMVATVRMVDAQTRKDDHPTDEWLRDWELLVKAREGYAAALLSGRAELKIPRGQGGEEIIGRMNKVWFDAPVCTVPRDLLNPYPRDLSAV